MSGGSIRTDLNMNLLAALWAMPDKRGSIAVDVNPTVRTAAIKLYAEKLPLLPGLLLLTLFARAANGFTRCVKRFAGHDRGGTVERPVSRCFGMIRGGKLPHSKG